MIFDIILLSSFSLLAGEWRLDGLKAAWFQRLNRQIKAMQAKDSKSAVQCVLCWIQTFNMSSVCKVCYKQLQQTRNTCCLHKMDWNSVLAHNKDSRISQRKTSSQDRKYLTTTKNPKKCDHEAGKVMGNRICISIFFVLDCTVWLVPVH